MCIRDRIQGVGQVGAQGGGAPAVRVEVNPTKLESFGLTLSSVQSALSLQNSHSPRGQLSDNGVSEDILTNDQISEAADYRPLIVGYHNGVAIKLSDVADVEDSTQTLRAAGYIDGKKGVVLTIFRQPGANIIDTVDRVKAQLPFLEAVLPAGVKTTVAVSYTHLDVYKRQVVLLVCLGIGRLQRHHHIGSLYAFFRGHDLAGFCAGRHHEQCWGVFALGRRQFHSTQRLHADDQHH